MKKLILILLSLIPLCASAWDVTIFNMGQKDMRITYRTCSIDYSSFVVNSCSEEKSALISSKKTETDKNYLTVKYDKSMPSPGTTLEITSATELGESGEVMSGGSFTNDFPINSCGGRLQEENNPKRNTIVLLEDVKNSSLISCSFQMLFFGEIK